MPAARHRTPRTRYVVSDSGALHGNGAKALRRFAGITLDVSIVIPSRADGEESRICNWEPLLPRKAQCFGVRSLAVCAARDDRRGMPAAPATIPLRASRFLA